MINMKYMLILLLLMPACSYEHKPVFMRFGGDQVAEGHSPSYKAGWADGCKTGEAVYGNYVTKSVRGFTRDAAYVGDQSYESAWYDAYHFCRQMHNTGINNWDSDWGGFLTLQ
ncbi:MAG: hypothetical protein COV36_03235 [Alphaproteobacteria bacterium CG11_big_fil_rev_8_21_14_0_20_44_7]|nr:MAG: hypothetical protein COV36_03235 [Alphaproteobacteria bacterium CG11_big_fil_rev_8_21_14_0_20_44_7]